MDHLLPILFKKEKKFFFELRWNETRGRLKQKKEQNEKDWTCQKL